MIARKPQTHDPQLRYDGENLDSRFSIVTAHKWAFSPRFRRNAFGWRSDAPIRRIKEAMTEIRQMARKNPVLGAEGAILFLEKVSGALMQVDGSSGALGGAVNKSIETLVPIIAKPEVDRATRKRWLDRLFAAIQNDEMPYIEHLGEFWGELCASPEVASEWADYLIGTVEQVWRSREDAHAFFSGTTACLSALFHAKRYEELLALLELPRASKWWGYGHWGVKALVAMGKKAEAVRYAEACRGLNAPEQEISRTCEEILLSSGLAEEAYSRYALEANQATTNLATFRAIAKKYPLKRPEDILDDLIASRPGEEGKWFATAKEAGFFDLAEELSSRSPTDPRTLIRAANDFATERPDFAVACALAALRWIALGHGYEITGLDVSCAYSALMKAASAAGAEDRVKVALRELISNPSPSGQFVARIIAFDVENRG